MKTFLSYHRVWHAASLLALLAAPGLAQEKTAADSAVGLIAAGKARDAVVLLQHELAARRDPTLCRLLGQAFYAEHQLSDAADAYAEAERLSRCDSCFSDVERQGSIWLEAGEFGKAQEFFATAEKRGSKTARRRLAIAFLREGQHYLAAKAYDKAEVALTGSVAVLEDTAAYAELLRCYYMSGDSAELQTLCTKVTQKYPDFLAPRLYRSAIYYLQGEKQVSRGDFREAIVFFTKALEQLPEYGDAFYGRGYCYSNLAETAKALENYEQSLRFGCQRSLAYFEVGVRRARDGRTGEAIGLLQKSLAQNQAYIPAWVKLSEAFKAAGNADTSVACLQMASWLGCGVCRAMLLARGEAPEPADFSFLPWIQFAEKNQVTLMPGEGPQQVLVDKAPVPIAYVNPGYPEFARRIGAEGTVWVALWITADGEVGKAVILKSENSLFNESAWNAALRWRFTPASLNGKPVSVWVSIPFRFKLNR